MHRSTKHSSQTAVEVTGRTQETEEAYQDWGQPYHQLQDKLQKKAESTNNPYHRQHSSKAGGSKDRQQTRNGDRDLNPAAAAPLDNNQKSYQHQVHHNHNRGSMHRRNTSSSQHSYDRQSESLTATFGQNNNRRLKAMNDSVNMEDSGDYSEQMLPQDARIFPLRDRTNVMHLVVNPSSNPIQVHSGKTTANFAQLHSAPLSMTSASSSVNNSVVVEPHFLRNPPGKDNRAAKKQFSYIQACKQSHNQSKSRGGGREENANRGESHGYRDSEKRQQQRGLNYIYVSNQSVDSDSYREEETQVDDQQYQEKRDERRSSAKRDSTDYQNSDHKAAFYQSQKRLLAAARAEEALANANHIENARMARQRIDLQTLSEPALVSSTENLHNHMNHTIRTRSDEHSDEKISREGRFSTISNGFAGRSASIEETENRPMRQMSLSSQSNNSNQKNSSNQAFKSQQFQMNRNQHQSAPRSGGQSGNKIHAVSAHFYSKHYGTGAQQQQNSHVNNRGERSSGRHGSRTEAANLPPHLGTINKNANVANQLIAQPSQTMMYGRRDSKNNTAQHSSSGNYYGNPTKAASGTAYSRESQSHQRTSNLLAKSTKDNHPFSSSLQHSTQHISREHQSRQSHDVQQNKQQIIQNLNQRYLGGQQNNNTIQHHFENTNSSAQEGIKQVKQQQQQQHATSTSKTRHQAAAPPKTHQSMSSAQQHPGYASVVVPSATQNQMMRGKQSESATISHPPRKSSASNHHSTLNPTLQKRDSTPTTSALLATKYQYDVRPRTSIEIGPSEPSQQHHYQTSTLMPKQQYHQQPASSSLGFNQSLGSTNSAAVNGGNHHHYQLNSTFMSGTMDIDTHGTLSSQNNGPRVSFLEHQVPPEIQAVQQQAEEEAVKQAQLQSQLEASRQNMLHHGQHHIKGRNLNSNNQSHNLQTSYLKTDGSIDYNKGHGNITMNSAVGKGFQTAGSRGSAAKTSGNVIGHGTIGQTQASGHHSSSQNKTTANPPPPAAPLQQQRPSTALRPKSSSQVGASATTSSHLSTEPAGLTPVAVRNNAPIIDQVRQRNQNYSQIVKAKGPQDHDYIDRNESLVQELSSIEDTKLASKEESAILDLKQIEDIMRASQQSNMFTIQPTSEPDLDREMLAQSNHLIRKNDEFGDVQGGEDYKRNTHHYHATISQDSRGDRERGRQRSSSSRDQRSKQRQATSTTSAHNTSIRLNEVDITINSPVNQQSQPPHYHQPSSASTTSQQPTAVAPSAPPQQQQPQTIIVHQTQSPEAVQKAKLRLEQVCQLLQDNKTVSSNMASEKEKQNTAVNNAIEDLILCQQNQYDSQCMRMLMDYQFRVAGEMQNKKLQDELQVVQKRFQAQQMLSVENKELKEKLLRQKNQLQEQERGVRKLERELEQIKLQFEVDNRETRIIRAEAIEKHQQQKTASNQSQAAANIKRHSHQQRASSQEAANGRSRSSTLVASKSVPPLDLSKVKAYEDYMKEKQVLVQKQQAKEKQSSLPPNNKTQSKHKTSEAAYAASGSSKVQPAAPSKQHMSTIQHSTKMNNFVGAEVNIVKMNASSTIQNDDDRIQNKQKNGSNHQFQAPLLQINKQQANNTLEQSITSHSLSPRVKGTGATAANNKKDANNTSANSKKGGRNTQAYMMRHSQEIKKIERPSTSHQQYSNLTNTINANESSFDNIKQSHNYSSATIEGSRAISQSIEVGVVGSGGNNSSKNDSQQQLMAIALAAREHQRMLQNRKRSMPASSATHHQLKHPQHQQQNQSQNSTNSSQVHIPLLDFSKLHKPAQISSQQKQLQQLQQQQNQASSQLKQLQQMVNKPSQPSQQQAQKKAMQPKQSMSSQHSHKQAPSVHSSSQQQQKQFSTIDVNQSATSKFNDDSATAVNDYSDNRMQRMGQQSYNGSKKKGSYEQLNNAMGTVQLKMSQQQSSHLSHSSKDGIGISQSMKVMTQQQQSEDVHFQYPTGGCGSGKNFEQLQSSSAAHHTGMLLVQPQPQQPTSSSQPSIKYAQNNETRQSYHGSGAI